MNRCSSRVVVAVLAAGVVFGPAAARAQGWDVIMPPIVQVGNTVAVSTSADLRTWMVLGPVPTLEACHHMMQSIRDTPLPVGESQDLRSALGLQKFHMQCVPDSTPGLPRR